MIRYQYRHKVSSIIDRIYSLTDNEIQLDLLIDSFE